ncbi:hypothetical protein [Muribaculum gordoncarteri]|nr:hypothetical protein [Muribaculum gordoncarteri]
MDKAESGCSVINDSAKIRFFFVVESEQAIKIGMSIANNNLIPVG